MVEIEETCRKKQPKDEPRNASILLFNPSQIFHKKSTLRVLPENFAEIGALKSRERSDRNNRQ